MAHPFRSRTGLALLVFAAGLLSAGAAPSGAQAPPAPHTQVRLQGVIVDAETYQPVEGATVSLIGTDLSATTGAWGSFEFPDSPLGVVSVRVRAPGRPGVVQDVEVRANRIAFVQVELFSIATTLEELVVSADRPGGRSADGARTAADLLALEVPRSRTNPSMVGDNDFQLRLRDGTTLSQNVEPMILIDGVVMSGALAFDALRSIPATDVAEIEVLKGPAAASLYPNAANGVVHIRTKKGGPRR